MADISRAELKYFVERQREEIKALNEVGRLLSSTTDPQEIMRLAAGYLHSTFPAALCAILYLPERKLHLIPFAPIAQVEMATAVRRLRDAAGQLLRRPVGENESELAIQPPSASMQPATPLRSHSISPLVIKGQATGVLGLFSGQAEAFTQEDQHGLGIVADQLAGALRNAFLVEELRRADELKNQLLSIVSHELSTPLTAIKEGVNLVLDGALGETTADQRDFLGTVTENAERLERLIQKIKTSTELMTGQAKFVFESIDLRNLLHQIDKSYRALAKSRGVNVKLVEPPKPLFWPVDVTHLNIALSQIIENAIQATPQDGVVTIRLTASATEAEILVSDSGSGIAKDALPTLFDRFKSIGDINNRKMGGLGLGLSISKALIEGHKGTIAVESALGEGTRMLIKLPKPSEGS
jgi:signal transduction histidine kinase